MSKQIIDFINKSNINSENFIFELCNFTITQFGGNIIEIGAGHGESTKKFLEISKKNNIKTIVIDPFESGWSEMPKSYGEPYPYEIFRKNCLGLEKNLIEIFESSQNKSVYDLLVKYTPISFSFVDGLQFKEAVLNDLNMMHLLETKIICVDDFSRKTEVSQVPEAVKLFVEKNNYKVFSDNKSSRSKAYLVRL